MRWIGRVTGSAVIVAAVALAAVLLHDAGDEMVRPDGVVAADVDRSGSAGTRDDRSHRQGPPPWVRGGEGQPPWVGQQAGKPSKDWQRRWLDLSERERDDLMSDLAREHAAAMRDFGRCVAEGRAGCERPMPPGLARKAELGR